MDENQHFSNIAVAASWSIGIRLLVDMCPYGRHGEHFLKKLKENSVG